MKGKTALIKSRGPRMGTSHYRPFRKAEPKPRGTPLEGDRPRDERALAATVRNEAALLRAAEALTSTHMSRIRPPPDGLVRAVATEVAVEKFASPRINRFDKALRTFCHLSLGYDDRHVVQEYLYVQLKGKIGAWKDGVRSRIESLAMQYLREPKVAKKKIKREPKMIERTDLEEIARQFIRDIEAQILSMADHGRLLKRESQQGYRAIKVTLGQRRAMSCFLIAKVSPAEEEQKQRPKVIRILSLKTVGEYNRSVRNRFTRKDRAQRFIRPRMHR